MPARSKRSKAQAQNWRNKPTPFFEHSPNIKEARSRLSVLDQDVPIAVCPILDSFTNDFSNRPGSSESIKSDLASNSCSSAPTLSHKTETKSKKQISLIVASEKTRMRQLKSLEAPASGVTGVFDRRLARFNIIIGSNHCVNLQIDTTDLICISTIERIPLPPQHQLTIKTGLEDVDNYIH